MLNVVSGPDERDLLSLPSDPTNFLGACEGGIRGLRVAWSPTLGYAKVDPEVARLTEGAAKFFETDLGCAVETSDPGFQSPWNSLSTMWVMSYALRLRGSLQEWENRMDKDLVTLIKRVERLNATAYGEAVANRSILWDTTRKFFGRFDLLLTPTLPVSAFPVSQIGPEQIPAPPDELLPFSDWVPFTYPWNMTGQPAATVPCGFTRDGLPVGLQIIGRRFADATVLRAAAAFEERRPWSDKRPLI
jgi:aspartyl-tRNA(Asn)/glutamyl-tRNA(Gln) amidotransferase subunit A